MFKELSKLDADSVVDINRGFQEKNIDCLGTHGFASDVSFVWVVRFYGGIRDEVRGNNQIAPPWIVS